MKNVDINGGLSINSNGRVYITSGGRIKFSNEDIKKDDNGLYRMEKTDYLTLNDGAWYNYYGQSTFCHRQ